MFTALILAAAAANAEIDRISAYEGTWKTHVVHVKTPLSEAGTQDATLQNVCRHSPGYYACEQVVDGEVKALLVFTYDPAQKTYTSHVFPAAPNAGTGTGTLIIEGNTWTFPWQQTQNGKTVYVRIVNTFTDADTIQFRQEFSYDKRRWTLMASGEEHRVHSP